MILKLLSTRLLALVLATLFLRPVSAQNTHQQPVDSEQNTESMDLAALQAAIEKKPGDMRLHEAYLKNFNKGAEVKEQYDKWMKKYPKEAVIPLALAGKLGVYSPLSRGYLLKAAALDPENPEIWNSLSFDAMLRGQRQQSLDYLQKAVDLKPDDLGLRMQYILSTAGDKDQYKANVYQFAKENPQSEITATLLHLLGTDVGDDEEKIQIWEDLRKIFPEMEILTEQVAMSRLADAYIRTGQYQKAIELSSELENRSEERFNFSPKIQLAKALIAIDSLAQKGNYEDAKKIALPLSTGSRNLFEMGDVVILKKASLLDAGGETAQAYDSLLLYQAVTPSAEVADQMTKLGAKIGKSNEQVKADISRQIAANSKVAPAFSLKSYVTGKEVKLSDLKGKVVFLSFWYPACGPCRAEMPHIEKALKKVNSNDVVYLGVNGFREQDDFVLPFVKGYKFSFQPLAGTDEMIKDYKVKGFPWNFLIDRDGNIAYSEFMIDADNEDMLAMMIESLL